MSSANAATLAAGARMTGAAPPPSEMARRVGEKALTRFAPDRPDAATARFGRRAFLRGLGGLAGAAALGTLAAPAGAAGGLGAGAWADLRHALKGDLLRPGDRGFALAARPH